ncbi:MAG TPA: hypothetical protein PK858_10780, partial [Saprospiraceae bacterium]|nr:hypothetical protein [Saprospiraceae bacterium]
MGQIYDGSNLSSPSAVANSQYHYGTDEKIFIEDQPLYRGTIIDTIAAQILAFQDINLLVDQYSKNDFGDTHSLVLIVDALNVQNLLHTLAPTATQSQIEAIFKDASNLQKFENSDQGQAEGNVLENVVNALGDLLLGPAGDWTRLKGNPNGGTWADKTGSNGYTGREDFYNALQKVSDKIDGASLAGQFTLAPSGRSLKDSARDDFAAFAALYNLSPFVLKPAPGTDAAALENAVKAAWGDTYTQWAADKALSDEQRSAGRATLSEQWLADRALFLDATVQANAANSTVVSLHGISAESATLLNLADTTSATALNMRFSAPESGGEVSRYIAFAGNQGEVLAGESLGDHLYGGTGADTLRGFGGKDHLEGGDGIDHLFGGEDDDTLIGGKGNDILEGGAG